MSETALKKILLAALLLGLALFSFLFLADKAAAPATHAATVGVIDEKTEDVLKLTASASLASFGVSAIPGDTATPIAGKLADFAEYFLLILCVLYSEKYLLGIIGAGVFKVLIPCACVLAGVSLVCHPRLFRRLAVKLAAVGIALYLLIPFSFKVSDMIYGAYRGTIDATIDAAETLSDETAPLADAAGDKGLVASILDRLSDQECRPQDGLTLKAGSAMIRILFSQLAYVEVSGKHLYFNLADGSVREVFGSLRDYESRLLERPEFMRTHRSYIVNMLQAAEFSSAGIRTFAGKELPVSRLLYPQLQKDYVKLLFSESGE